MSDDDTPIPLLDLILRANISPARAEDHLRAGRVRIGDEYVTDGARLFPPGTSWVLVS